MHVNFAGLRHEFVGEQSLSEQAVAAEGRARPARCAPLIELRAWRRPAAGVARRAQRRQWSRRERAADAAT